MSQKLKDELADLEAKKKRLNDFSQSDIKEMKEIDSDIYYVNRRLSREAKFDEIVEIIRDSDRCDIRWIVEMLNTFFVLGMEFNYEKWQKRAYETI